MTQCKVYYSDDDGQRQWTRPSIFLAGPTPRDKGVPSWRPEALKIISDGCFDGDVFVPEWSTGEEMLDYDDQVEWEDRHLTNCAVILFWVPRDLATMPAFTTNIEFGRFVERRLCVYGRPDGSPKNRYLDWLYKKSNPGWEPLTTLGETVRLAMKLAQEIRGNSG
jgi:hypothetical protein